MSYEKTSLWCGGRRFGGRNGSGHCGGHCWRVRLGENRSDGSRCGGCRCVCGRIFTCWDCSGVFFQWGCCAISSKKIFLRLLSF